MVWNTELEEIAQRWADQCTFAHDRVRNKKDGTRVGQNAYTASGPRKSESDRVQKSMASVTQAWYNEVENPGFKLYQIIKHSQFLLFKSLSEL